MLKRLLQRWRPRRFGSAAELRAFLDRNAWMVSQKSVVGYCMVKSQMPIHELLRESAFEEVYEISIREAYGAVMADLVVVAEGFLRPHAAGQAAELNESLVRLYCDSLAGHSVTLRRPEPWDAEIEALRRRLASAPEPTPSAIREISEISARRIYETLPIHERLRGDDQPAIEANAQFLIVGLAHEFRDRMDAPAVTADLLSVGPME